jgi:transketolase
VELKSQVEYFGRALVEKGASIHDLVVLDADVSDSTKTAYFMETYPERFIQVGISEQDLIGIAAGLALSGKTPVAAAFANFIVGRAWEQILNTVSRQELNVKIVGTHSGLSPHADGGSHQSVADIATMRVLPNMEVVVPADAAAAGCLIKGLIDQRGPAYLRLSRGFTPIVYPDDVTLSLGEAVTLAEGQDIAIIALGNMVNVARQAAKALKEKNIGARVVDMHTVKPLDEEALLRAARDCGAIVTVEEHSVMGGLGGAVAELLTQEMPTPMRMIGIQDRFGGSSRTYPDLLKKYGLTPEAVVDAAVELVEMR